MSFTNEDYLPTFEEITVPELQLSSAALRAGAHHFGKYCNTPCKEYMLCCKEEPDPRKCLAEGKEVTRCAFEFFGKVKQSCYGQFTKYFECIDHAGRDMSLADCRKTQCEFDKCVKQNLGQDRPELGYFSRPRLHHTERPKPVLPKHKLPKRPDPLPDFDNAGEPKHPFPPTLPGIN